MLDKTPCASCRTARAPYP